MLLEVGKAVSFLGSLLSMLLLLERAFFVPGIRWEERLTLGLEQLVLSGCVCLVSGLVFTWPSAANPEAGRSIFRTLPVKLYLWAALGAALLLGCPGTWRYLMCRCFGRISRGSAPAGGTASERMAVL